MRKHPSLSRLAAVLLVLACSSDPSGPPDQVASSGLICHATNGGITLPARFCAIVVADLTGGGRHIAVATNGDVYVNQPGKGITALRDNTGDGIADVEQTFGFTGGTGIVVRDRALWADYGNVIVRYQLPVADAVPVSPPDTIVSGLPTGGHGSRSIAIDNVGQLFIGVGSSDNLCGGTDPCAELATRAGVFRFDANTLRQPFTAARRFASGIRNAVGLAIDPADGKLFVTQHGRDVLFQSYPGLFTSQAGADNPGEEVMQVNQGDDFGWPYCYHDFTAGKRVIAPEYGGNRQTVGRCSTTAASRAALPGHWAPNALTFYSGTMFPQAYRGGVFIAFHGSWNRAPLPQAGFNVTYLPLTSAFTTTHEVFASGFAGAGTISDPGSATYRPTGVAVGPDGSLYITDDVKGRVWRVIYR